ncbi:MAG: glycoside hydrolase family 15 protein [Acetobacteraceae bacterium]|nr:glycoside hydrolase family 15 protein [Acetobacteraceae bacterium]
MARIEDYALIGDGETAALVRRDGSIDWLCWPRFDSDACFAALLGTEQHGRWSLAPANPIRGVERRYRENTLILETDFVTDRGAVRLIDFMPIRGLASDVVRIVQGLDGAVNMRSVISLRFDYGNLPPWLERNGDAVAGFVGPDLVAVRAPVPLELGGEDVTSSFIVSGGERVPIVMSYGSSLEDPPKPIDPEKALSDTENFWQDWCRQCNVSTKWPDAVTRSLITLKALMYRPSGGALAAPTTSLPEQLGRELNWDYRYCWVRDATFTLTALINAGFHEEATRWRDWLLRAVAGSPDKLQIMYRVLGERHLNEWEIGWLPGYEGSKPVRVGNRAAEQRQLDVYGELLDALHLARRAGMAPRDQGLHVEAALVQHLQEIWELPDQGLWESRGDPKQYVYSKVMAWVGLEAFLKSKRTRKLVDDEARDRLARTRQKLHDQVCERGFNSKIGSFVKSYDSSELDASLLLIPLVGFLPIEDERVKGTIIAIENELMEGGLVRRYKPKPGHHEGAFIACSFWLVDCLNRLGRRDDAHALFERVLDVRNDLGLLSEEYDVPHQRLVGNFPQAFSHVALVVAALNLSDEMTHHRHIRWS